MLRRPLLYLVLLLLAAAVVGVAALGFVELPMPKSRVERVVPSDRLPR